MIRAVVQCSRRICSSPCLGASPCTYAEATAGEQLASWIGAHVRAFDFYHGVPKLVVPDNTRTGVAVRIGANRMYSNHVLKTAT